MSNKAQAWAWQVEIGGVAKLVLVALADHADDKGICWPGARGLAAKCGVTERTIRANLKALAEQGLIEAEERRRDDGSQASNRYYLNMEIYSPQGVNASPQGEIDREGRVKQIQGEGEAKGEGRVKQKGSHEPSLETKLEPSIETPNNNAPEWLRILQKDLRWPEVDAQYVAKVEERSKADVDLSLQALKAYEWLQSTKGRAKTRLSVFWLNWLEKAIKDSQNGGSNGHQPGYAISGNHQAGGRAGVGKAVDDRLGDY